MRSPIIRHIDEDRSLSWLLEDGTFIALGGRDLVLLREGWFSAALVSVGDHLVMASPDELIVGCIDCLRREGHTSALEKTYA